MARSHKDSNRLALLSALASNLLLYYALARGLDLGKISTGAMMGHLNLLLPGGLAIAFTSIVNAQLNSLHKARIVFWRWTHPLPGTRVFTELAPDDPRIDLDSLNAHLAPLPVEPRQQNSLWYRLYQEQQDTAAVSHLDRNWLFARDYCCVIALLAPILIVAGLWQLPSLNVYASLVGLLVFQFLVARQAAKNYAERFVTTVVAQALAKLSAKPAGN
ncbi:hypothetical protein H9654_02110 [Stenotrophomonas sp. Sa5BUN4]|uniref:Uncharacterized protein n=1 Tax=Stenotrophomonas lacuserhaii TaxID=2760084 RepID=A0A8X8FSL0_9GAMM|nr:hypothetical protein [Stenotrophomonas pennii]MBD7952986.1 hypothetical protein [Stenotrophomonas pennii]